MAAPRLRVIGAIVRKDVIGLWPLVLGASLLPICLVAERLVDVPNAAKALIAGIGALAMGALVVTVFHQDAAPSVRHDWKTRPIDALSLVIAKVAFLFITLGLPIFAAQFARELLQDHSVSEALFSALFILSTGLLAVIPVILLALVTSSLVEAFVIMFAYVIVSVLATALLPRPGDAGAGAAWIMDEFSVLVGAVFAIAIAVLLFRRKAPGLARLTFFVGIVVSSLGFVYMPGRAAFAVGLQQGLGADAPQARNLTATIANVCGVKDGWRRKSLMQKPEPLLLGEMAISGQPAGWQVAVDHLRAGYLDRNGKAVHSVWAKAREAAPPSAEGNTFELESVVRAGGGIEKLRWTYALTLLEPVATQDLTADDKRRYVPGFGYCQARATSREIDYRCFKPFGQPAAISTEVPGKPETFNLTSTAISYKPAFLEGVGNYRRGSTRPVGPGMRLSSPPVVRLTAYAPRAHVSRQTTTTLAAGAVPICEKKR